MDYYNFSPNLADSLDLFRPSKQRNLGNNNVGRLPYECLSGLDTAQWRRHCPSTKCLHPHLQRSDIASSNSIFFNKSNFEIYDKSSESYRKNLIHCPVSSDHSTHFKREPSKNQPLIQITVIPNNAKVRKRKSNSKRVQNTTSNQENSIKANNVYLIVAGKKKQKIFEIKAAGSAEFSNNQINYGRNEEVALDRNLAQLLSSLNMDKKKKKGKKKKDEDLEEKTSIASLVNMLDVSDGMTRERDCMCSEDMVKPRKSRVRISGRLGLTGDDQYVLKCAATIDDKPVETNFIPEPRFNLASCFESRDTRDQVRISCQKEANVQTSIQPEEAYSYCQANRCPEFVSTFTSYRSVETQCNPNNFNTVSFSNIERLKIASNRDQMIQCECAPQMMNSTRVGTEFDNNICTGKCANNPLVIISVYQKKDSMEINTTSSDKIPLRERAPGECSSPPKNSIITTRKGKKKQDDIRDLKSPRSLSPDSSKVKGGKKGNKNVKDKAGQDTKSRTTKAGESNKKKSGKKSPVLEKSIDTYNVKATINQAMAEQIPNYTARVNTQMMKWVRAKNDKSVVAINIAGENELYDVVLRQNAVATDLHDLKTIKTPSPEESTKVDNASLENFLLYHENNRKRSFSQTFLSTDLPKAEVELAWNQAIPRINVRDSIEISHRREEKSDSSLTPTSSHTTSTTTGSKSKLFYAPVKHFQGDNCDVPNPVERDKEIRELLGIGTTLSKSKESKETTTKAEGDTILFDLNRAKRNNNTYADVFKSDPTLWNMGASSSSHYYHDVAVQKDDSSTLEIDKVSPTQPEVQWIYRRVQCPYIPKYVGVKEPLDDMIVDNPRLSKIHLYQQMISNPQINMYLDLPKQKSIVLTRKHYAKLKRTIENSVLKRARLIDSFYKKKTICYTLGDIKLKRNQHIPKHADEKHVVAEKHIPITTEIAFKKLNKHSRDKTANKEHDFVKTQKSKKKNDGIKFEKEVFKSEDCKKNYKTKKLNSKQAPKSNVCGHQRNMSRECVPGDRCYYCQISKKRSPEVVVIKQGTRHSASSTELHFRSVTLMKHVTFSSINLAAGEYQPPLPAPIPARPTPHVLSPDLLNNHHSDSLYTLFKGHRKSPTPNLGTSGYSLFSESSIKSSKAEMSEDMPQNRKPFLKRLMSCLVMRSKISNSKLGKKKPRLISGNSTIDTYHISSSLGAIELSSSIYDTSASFYTSHSIHPVTSKMKRGFLTSVRDYLTNRK